VTGSQGFQGPIGTGTQGPQGPAGSGGSVAITSKQIAIGNGTGITSSSTLTFDYSSTFNLIVGPNTSTGGNRNSVINGQGNNQCCSSSSSILGGYQNGIISGHYNSIIGGGYSCLGQGLYNSIIGGRNNTINYGSQNSIIGGSSNMICMLKSNAGQNTILGGSSNTIGSGPYETYVSTSAIIGGNSNFISGRNSYRTADSVIIGGYCNKICCSCCSAIIGGNNNRTAYGCNSVLIGGNNLCLSQSNTVAVPSIMTTSPAYGYQLTNIPWQLGGYQAGGMFGAGFLNVWVCGIMRRLVLQP
jgi:hypothetical protein